jgi:phenylacetate-coenzyme A ligase PaaK-like adenylate-forming protein
VDISSKIRQTLFFSLVSLRGKRIGKYYRYYLDQVEKGIAADTTKKQLVALLDHCKKNVPYYYEIMNRSDGNYHSDPFEYLKNFPILTREKLRVHFKELQSKDLHQRHWYESSSGGSTGEPARFILDRDFAAQSVALTLLYSKLVGRELGELEIQIWGSLRDIAYSHDSVSAYLANLLSNQMTLNAFRMTPDQMERYLEILNREKAKLILAYAQPLYTLARFSEQKNIFLAPQPAIITSAGTLYQFMRDEIEQVFQCKVYNRYGCREVGDIACERPGMEGLWVAPWGCYVEIVDDDGKSVQDGQEGNILLTCFTNYSMPLIRYSILDRGSLLPEDKKSPKITGQVFREITGRTLDSFRKRDGTIITPNVFTKFLYYRDWIDKFQVIQKDYEHIIYKFVKSNYDCEVSELKEIKSKTQLIMGEDCIVDIEFVSEIAAANSGKYRFCISEVHEQSY